MACKVFMISDFVDPSDPLGRTARQINQEKTHKIPIGTFVEMSNGCRAWVVGHRRDCDGTPLYSVSLNQGDTERRDSRFGNNSWDTGWSEEGLVAIEPRESLDGL